MDNHHRDATSRRCAAIDALADRIYETNILVRSIIDQLGRDEYARLLKQAFADTTADERRALCNQIVASACEFAAEVMRVDHQEDPTAALYWEAHSRLLETPQPAAPPPP